MATLLLDASVIIDVLNDRRGRRTYLLELVKAGLVLACCPIKITEVQHFPIAPPAARLAGELKRDYGRKGTTLNLGDVIIAAVAIHYGLTLLTGNVKDFPMVDLLLLPLPNPS